MKANHNARLPYHVCSLLSRLGKVVNKKKVQAEGFEKYFNKVNGKYESNDNNFSEVVVKDALNKAKDGVSSYILQIYIDSFTFT